MFRNRMSELVQYLPDPSVIGCKLRDSITTDIPPEQTPQNKALEKVKLIKNVTLMLERSGREYFKATRTDKRKAIYEQINTKIAEGNSLLKELKPLIEQINQDFKARSEKGDMSLIVDCKRTNEEASAALRDFQQAQERITADMRDTIQRQARLTQGKDISQKQMEDLLLHPEKGQEMLKDKLLDAPSVQLENEVSDIIDKCNDVQKLEKSMRECLGMMEELALLVHIQGDKLLTIENAIGGAADHIFRADGKLESGKELHKKSKKKMCCIMMLLLVIIGIIVIPIIITQLK